MPDISIRKSDLRTISRTYLVKRETDKNGELTENKLSS
ncbi:hypothetical protein SPAR14_2148 [Streptococcus pneumoniae GA07643]|nr:hypothetical protein SPAR14_2148 [Streptococcus pneumoniae GA07643]EHE27946.1 hypothetical protein SPAR92_2151 [Streptococcus pneumoniae GA47360]EHE64262.1 hypothetical protein SPAR136_2260 [Streptococcus pneumoniae EU-NP01]EHZ28053.1 hypothetical protein SPAR53_2169 [Streptococcus pneumoniae GA18068]EJG32598.1 hypothetical protein AMCSP11_002045 [Streptococcus pneumoniae 2070005]EJG65934.1 hypothetical protein AMCSP09_002137 [Streptococcus pneumoniae 2081074]EJG72205.1 hypothetical protei